VTVPALAIGGGKSPAWMQNAVRALALPNAQAQTLAGQNHDVSAKAVAPVLKAFFGSGDARSQTP
jgi:hypothetical protein